MQSIPKNLWAALVVSGAYSALPASAAFVVTVEQAGVEESTAQFSLRGVERFDGLSLGVQSLITDYGLGGAITGVYSPATVTQADAVGGAGGAGQYLNSNGVTGAATYSLSLSGNSAVNYFGFWYSAASSGNRMEFYNGNSLVYTFLPQDLISYVDADYFGNPVTGQNRGEAYAFVNFYDTSGTFDRIIFSANGDGFESDNHTVGIFTTTSGEVISAVPEPSVMLTLGLGLGIVGWTARRRRGQSAA